MKVLIIEDETAAATNLKALLKKSFPSIEILGTIESVVDSVDWFDNNPCPDIVFMDIHLADGNAFNIFGRTEVNCPIIFTTAYDQYALEAFKVNSVDYLLKPIKESELERAIAKLELLSKSETQSYSQRINEMVAAEQSRTHAILTQVRDKIIPLRIEDIAYCYSSNEKITICTKEGDRYPADKSLEALTSLLPKDDFFRANRQFIVSRDAIKDISVWFGSRLSVNLMVSVPEKIIISKARVPEFKKWISGN